jgi:hypothetical protein
VQDYEMFHDSDCEEWSPSLHYFVRGVSLPEGVRCGKTSVFFYSCYKVLLIQIVKNGAHRHIVLSIESTYLKVLLQATSMLSYS